MRDLVHTANSTLTEWKRIDDKFDQYLPGYSGFKQYHAPYLLLRETYQAVKQQSLNLTAKEQAIHWVRNADAKKTWIYATWKMKANLIYDLGKSGSGWLGGFSEEDSEECIIKVLKTSRSDWEFGKILQVLKLRGLEIDSCVDWKEQDELDQLKLKYHYRGV